MHFTLWNDWKKEMKRVAIKIGSNVLTRADGTLDVTRMSALVDQVAELYKNGIQLVLISSGAVASGRSELGIRRKMDSVDQRQLFSAVGQAKLINRYFDFFREHHIAVGQVLTMKESFGTRRHYLNQRNCIEVMLENKVIPIINENDTVSLTELMFTDNDELSGLIASMIDADTLIILSNIDGIYDGSPKAPGSKIIRYVGADQDLSAYIQAEKSGFGRGGMITKCNIARKVSQEGIRVFIANGKRENILLSLVNDPDNTLFTCFEPAVEQVSSVKKWIAHSGGFAKGSIQLNMQAVKTIRGKKAVSILPVGVIGVDGEFEKDDIVSILDEQGHKIGVGKVGYSSEEAVEVLGKRDQRPMVHYDYLYLE